MENISINQEVTQAKFIEKILCEHQFEYIKYLKEMGQMNPLTN